VAPGSYTRYVAIGDSTTEGLDDPLPSGGYRGWADRLAERLAGIDPIIEYANLAVRGRLAAQVRDQQLEQAVALEPDLASVVAGLNDALRPGFDVDRVAAEIELMQSALSDAGATVLTFTMADPTPVIPITRPLRPRLLAFNDALREVADRTGAVLVDFARHPVTSDPRLWSVDRLHANSAGHERIAAAAAHALGLPGTDESWAEPLPPPPSRSRIEVVGGELGWAGRYLVPWLGRRIRGRSSGDGIEAKRPAPAPVSAGSGE
jgi:lysophospholipase L1-like esterase